MSSLTREFRLDRQTRGINAAQVPVCHEVAQGVPVMLIPTRLIVLTGLLIGEAIVLPVLAGLFLWSVADEGISQSTTAIGALAGGYTLMMGLMAWVVKYLLGTTIPELNRTAAEKDKIHQQTILDLQKTHNETDEQRRKFYDSSIQAILGEANMERQRYLDAIINSNPQDLPGIEDRPPDATKPSSSAIRKRL
jgi:hypothetical protein